VPLVFSAFLSQLPCNLLEFFLQLRVRLANLLELFPEIRSEERRVGKVCGVALESFLQQRRRVTRLFQLCQERLFLPIYLDQSFLQFVALLVELLELLPVPPVFSAFLSQLPCNLLEFFLQLRVRLANLLELFPEI